MNFNEAIELLRALSNFHLKSAHATSWTRPKIVPHDATKEAYGLVVKDALEPGYLSFLEEIVETRNYRIKKQSGYLFIHSS